MTMRVTLNLLGSNAEIEADIFRALVKEINKSFPAKVAKLRRPIQSTVRTALFSSPEVSSLLAGKLRYDFGIPKGVDVAGDIIDAVVGSVYVQAPPVKSGAAKNIKSDIQISVQPLDFQNILGLSSGTVISEKGASLPWLDWLLTAGDKIIIANFGVRYGAGRGRSGGGSMSASEKFRPFKVDTAFSGTIKDNFISRALQRFQPTLIKTIERGLR